MRGAFPIDPAAWTTEHLDLALSRVEWDDLEFKSGFRSLTEASTAFANTDGGWLVIGVADKGEGRARLRGVETREPQPLDTELGKIEPSLRIGPPAFLPLASGSFIPIIRIERGSRPPYQAENGIFYRRSGSSSVPMKRGEVFEAMITSAGIRGNAQQLLAVLAGFRDLALRAGHARDHENVPYLLARVNAERIGDLCSKVHPVADGEGHCLPATQIPRAGKRVLPGHRSHGG